MGTRGPIPKRSDRRIRRNKDQDQPEIISAIGRVAAPPLGFEAHPMIEDFYDSLQDSAQAQYYEPSDWEFARITLHFLNGQLLAKKPSAQMYAAINTALSNLLVSEGDRRRVKVEIDRETATEELADVASIFRERLSK